MKHENAWRISKMKQGRIFIMMAIVMLLFGCNVKDKYSENIQNGYKHFEDLIPLLNDKIELYTQYDKIWIPENFYEYINVSEMLEEELDISKVVEDFYGWDYGYRMEKGTIVINVDDNEVIALSMIPKFDEENIYEDSRVIIDAFVEVMNQEYNMLLGNKYRSGMTLKQLEEYMLDYYTEEAIKSLMEEIPRVKERVIGPGDPPLSPYNMLVPSWIYDEETDIYELFTRDTIQTGDIYTNYKIVAVNNFSESRIDVLIIGEYIYDSINYHEYFVEKVKLMRLESGWMLIDLLETNKEAAGIK